MFEIIKLLFLFSFYFIFNSVNADTPANCAYEDVRGLWLIYEGPRNQDKHFDCSNFTDFKTLYQVRLDFPNIATDQDGNVGYWTMIYNQGFEVVIAGRKYFGFSLYRQQGGRLTVICKHTFTSYSHDVGVDPKNWSCWTGERQNDPDYLRLDSKLIPDPQSTLLETFKQKRFFKPNFELINKINMKQSDWQATHYDFMENMRISELIRMLGGKISKGFRRPKPTRITPEIELLASQLPNSFDWRNINGTNYVSPIRNQKTCGSCYAFASMAMHEARLKIKTNNKNQTVFSTQDIVECSFYSQGCDGGFPYLVAGKYAEDFGLVEENCNPYKGVDGKCMTNPKCERYYATNYRYIGGFYGACNEALMRISLVKNGPIAVSFEVYDDFLSYKSGIYHHTGFKDEMNFGFDPFELTNHVVVIVGYGTDTNGQDYWIVKNSWGTEWGENGFFRIRRGSDECSIESIAMEADIIV